METLIRTVILYAVVVAALRVLGKRQIGELQPNELVVTLLISEMAAIPMQDMNRPLSSGVLAILTLTVLGILLSVISLKSKKIRRALNGKPALIINKGVIDQKMMKKTRMTVDDVMEDLRLQGVFRLENVEYALMETNGKISVLQRAEVLPAPASDAKIAVGKSVLPGVVISDGRLLKDNLAFCNQTQEKIQSALANRRLSERDVFMMTADENDKYIVIEKQK